MYITSFFLASRDVKGSPESQKSSSPRVHSGPLYKGSRTPDPEGNVMGPSTEMSPLVSMIFKIFLNPLNFLIEVFNVLLSLKMFQCTSSS